ncbi:MAG: hypothetical protein JO278_08715, partial [Dyella sp.]|nr:hypothetical protein [Dyella sp.]
MRSDLGHRRPLSVACAALFALTTMGMAHAQDAQNPTTNNQQQATQPASNKQATKDQ